MKVKLTLTPTSLGGRKGYILPGYRPSFRIGTINTDCYLSEFKKINPGETGETKLELIHPEKFNLNIGDVFILTEGKREIAQGIIIEL